MILIYSSNHMRMWHHLVLALNWSFFDSEGWMMNTHTFISGRGKFQSLDRKMLAVHDWGHRVQWVSPRVSLFIRRLYEPCVCCAVDNTSPGRRRWMGRSRGRGVRAWHGSGATHDTPMSHSHPDFFLNETHCSLSRIWNLSWLSVFRYWYVVADCMTVWLYSQTTSSEARVSFNSRRCCVSSLWQTDHLLLRNPLKTRRGTGSFLAAMATVRFSDFKRHFSTQ